MARCNSWDSWDSLDSCNSLEEAGLVKEMDAYAKNLEHKLEENSNNVYYEKPLRYHFSVLQKKSVEKSFK